MRNKFAGRCRDCGCSVMAGEGYFHNNGAGAWPKWSVRCIPCVAKARAERGDNLSLAQQHALAALGEGE